MAGLGATAYHPNPCFCGHDLTTHLPSATVTVGGSLTNGDTETITINGTPVVHTTTAGDTSLAVLAANIATGLIAAFIGQGIISVYVSGQVITIAGNTPGSTFSLAVATSGTETLTASATSLQANTYCGGCLNAHAFGPDAIIYANSATRANNQRSG